MKLALENLHAEKISELETYAKDKISIRGNHPKYRVPADFANTEWFLPFNEIPIKYCPTDRYSFLNKYQSSIPKTQTWPMLKGNILDDMYEQFINNLISYLNSKELSTVNVLHDFEEFESQIMTKITEKIDNKKNDLLIKPEDNEIDDFKKLITSVIHFETQLGSALIDYKISMNDSLELKTMVTMLFPFVSKPTYTITSFGITNRVQPDFLFDNKIIIDVKSPPWIDDYYVALGGYALVYEKSNEREMNLGMIVTPEYNSTRKVPFYFNSEIVPIEDRYRREFLLRRDKLLELIKNNQDPGVPTDTQPCTSCAYFNHCCGS
ncbi:MAG: CRISPR-associated protein Cas4 [Nitrosopumilus sp.]|nr:CRISPR-associated protein Cas4 [Nitrosopumilus sp.]